MHESSGTSDHFFNKIRRSIRDWEEDRTFMADMREAQRQVSDMVDHLSLKTPKEREDDPQYNNVMTRLHSESIRFRNQIKKVINKIKTLQQQKDAAIENNNNQDGSEDDEDEDGDGSSFNEIDDQINEIDDQIDALREQADTLWEQCKTHAVDSNYSHFVQLNIGLLSFSKGLSSFLQKKSKRLLVVNFLNLYLTMLLNILVVVNTMPSMVDLSKQMDEH